MTTRNVGRNDPCPCGSGKKYKHCCLRQDQQLRRERRKAGRAPSLAAEGLPGMVQRARWLTQELKKVPGEEARALEEQGHELTRMATRLAARAEVDAAMKTLEAHKDVFEELMADPAVMDRAVRLFSEDRFAGLRFSTDELEEAFGVVGYPAPGPQGFGDAEMEILMKAAVHLAGDEEARVDAAWVVLEQLPEIVAAGRLKDAWLIQHSAHRLITKPGEPNALMFAMVVQALETWEREMMEKQESMIEELGIDPSTLRGTSFDQLCELAQEVTRDPHKRARIEQFFTADPMLQSQAEREWERLWQDAVNLMKRPDAQCLLLSPAEVEPWLSDLAEHLEDLRGRFGALAEPGERPDQEAIQVITERIADLTAEMSAAIYDSERIDELRESLRAYARRLDDAAEEEAARWAEGALMLLEVDLPPQENPFLRWTCHASMREAIRAAAGRDAQPGGAGRAD